MAGAVTDFHPALKAAIAEARAAGLDAAAAALEQQAFSAGATSSELLGETGRAIRQFLRSQGTAVPASVADKLEQCLREIRKVWPRL